MKFEEQAAERACQHCPLKRGCHLLKCPNCGFEMPPEPKWLAKLLGRKNDHADQ
jgi:hypothetical protein